MTALTIRQVPDTVLVTLKVRAAQVGKSLQAYALEILEREATKPTLADIAVRAESEASSQLTTNDVLQAIREGRQGR